MKRIAIYYSVRFGRNDGCPLYWFNQLRKSKNFEVMHLDPKGDTSKFGKFDYHFWIDWGEDGLPWQYWLPPEDGGKRIYVCSDAHLGKDYRFTHAHNFDYVFFNQHRFMNDFTEWNLGHPKIKSRIKQWDYLPHAVEPQAYPAYKIIKKYDVAFIGHIQTENNALGLNRIEALDRLFAVYPNFYFGFMTPAYPDKNKFEHAARQFAQSKIVFNISAKDDLNMRVFETMATGSMLLTDRVPDLKRHFEENKHYVGYSSYKEMLEKVKYYITHDKEREDIAKQGQKRCLKEHTYKNRIKTVFNKINEVIKF